MTEFYQQHQGQTLHIQYTTIELGYSNIGLIVIYIKDSQDKVISKSVKTLHVEFVPTGLADKKDVKKIMLHMASKGNEFYDHLQAWFLTKGEVHVIDRLVHIDRRVMLPKMRKKAKKGMGGWSKSHIDHLQMMLAQNDENGI